MEGTKGKILVVDDEAFIRKLLHQKLAKEFYDCDEADSADNALNKMKADNRDLVISDIIMPEKSGIELLNQIKCTYPDTAVIMATAVTEMNTAIECLKKGADDYVCKPFDLEQVSSSVQKALEKRKLQMTLKEYQSRLKEKIENQTKEIRKLSLGAIEALVIALEAKDKYTAGHSRRVTDISMVIGQEMKLSAPELEDIRWGSLLHDVGKIAVNQMILNKPGDLNKEEYEHVMVHAYVGAGIVRPVVNDNVVRIVEHHHDHYDGSGLNQNISGKSISLGARILAVADAFDAMTSERPYRQALSIEYSLEEIRKHSGSQFDPEIAALFLKLYSRPNVEKISGLGFS
jgi:putative two-component system response regulator